MKKYKIAIGTIYEQKIRFLEEILREIGVRAEVIPIKVKSGVSDQPITQEETSKGSINRARQALEKTLMPISPWELKSDIIQIPLVNTKCFAARQLPIKKNL